MSALRVALLVTAVFVLGTIATLWWARGTLVVAIHESAAEVAAWADRLVERTGYFTIDRITVRGAHVVPTEDIIAAIDLPPSANIWHSLRLPALGVRKVPGIIDARVDRRLPDEIVVSVREAAPVGWIGTDSASHELLLSSGDVIRNPVNTENLAGLPLITALGDTAAGAITALHHLIHSGLPWARNLRAEITPAGDIRITLPSETVVILPPGPTPPTASLLEAVLADRTAADTTKAAENLLVDLRFSDQIIVRPR